jgi:asparagine synthase (glutamine-hydrolysing)
MSDEQLVDKVEATLRNSIESQLFADAPVGALCSGGVDSSLVLALAAKTRPDFTVFHANVVGRTSEYHAARELATHLGLDLRVVDVEDQDFIQTLPEVMSHYEQPFTFHPESIAYLSVCQLVNRHQHKAVLSGEGADELFVGYSSSVPRLSQLLWRKYVGVADRTAGIFKRLRRKTLGTRRAYRLTFDDRDLVRSMHNRFERDLEIDRIRSTCSERLGVDLFQREWSTLHQLTYGLRTLMHRNDSLGMAASVEARFPFLDSRLMRLAVNLPYRCKVRPGASLRDPSHRFVRDKWILRKIADRYLPRSLSHRKKIGFPTSAFQRLVIPPQIFENSFVPDLFGLSAANLRYLTARAGPGLKLRLLHLDVWGNICLRDMTTDSMADRLRCQLRVAA